MLHVLRLGHRPMRDARVTTHVALVARAMGADGITIAESDSKVERSVAGVVERFGGPFVVESGVAWRPFLRRWKARGGVVVHLTMYGESVDEVVRRVLGRDVLLVVGAEKVPGDLYALADFNAAVGHQPHSEVAALAIALDRLTGGAWQARAFEGRVRIVPSARGKSLIETPPNRTVSSRRNSN